MKKNYIATASLAGVLALLVLWYALYEKNYKQTRKQAEEKTKLLTTLDRNDIHELVVERRKADDAAKKEPAPEILKLREANGEWTLVEPVAAPADGGAVNSMLSTLTTTKHERVVEEQPKDLAQYGLEPPLLKIQVRKDATANFEEIRLGKETPVGFSIYATGAGGPAVYRVSQSLKTVFEKTVKDVRDKRVVAVNRNDIEEIEVQAGGRTLHLKKAEKDQWLLPKENLPASRDEVNKLLTALGDLRATEFPSEDPKAKARYGLEPARFRVTLTSSPDKKKTLLLAGSQGGKAYVMVDGRPSILEVEKELLTKLEKPAREYRSREVASFNRFNINRIRLDRGKESIELLKAEGGWSLPADSQAKIDDGKVDSLLTKLQDAKLVDYSSDGAKVTSPSLVISLFQKDDRADKPTVKLSFAQPAGKRVLVEREGAPSSFYLDLKTFQELPSSKAALLKAPEKKAEEKKAQEETKDKRS